MIRIANPNRGMKELNDRCFLKAILTFRRTYDTVLTCTKQIRNGKAEKTQKNTRRHRMHGKE